MFIFANFAKWQIVEEKKKCDVLLLLQHAENQGDVKNFIHSSANIYWAPIVCQTLV